MKRSRREEVRQDYGTKRPRKHHRNSDATTSPISQLPNELMIHVLRLFRNGCPEVSDYINAITCCKHWAGLGIDLTHADLVIDGPHTLTRFMTVFPRQHIVNLTSLTILIDDANDHATNWSATHIYVLPFRISEMIRLKAFSLTINGQTSISLNDPEQTDGFLQQFIENCLDHLPQSVTDLELCTSKMRPPSTEEPSPMWPEKHLCKALNNVLPRLHRLSLQLRDTCPLILGTSQSTQNQNTRFPHLRQVFIDISSPTNALVTRSGSVMTPRLSDLCNQNRYEPCHTVPSAMEMVCQVMLRDLRKAIDNGAFPSIRTFTIHRAEVPRIVDSDGQGFIHILDLVANTTTSIPVSLRVNHTGPTRILHVQLKSASGGGSLPACAVLNIPFLADLGAWYTTSNGPRLPGIYELHEYDPRHTHFLQAFRIGDLVPSSAPAENYEILFLEDSNERSRRLAESARRWDVLLQSDLKYGLIPPGYRASSALVAEVVMQFAGSHLYSLVLLGDTKLERVE